MNQPVVIYGAGLRGGTNFMLLAKENIHVAAFCDRDAENIPLYYGCEVLTREEALKKYPHLPYIVSFDNEKEKENVVHELKEAGIEAYVCFEEFFQGLNDVNIETCTCGAKETYGTYQIVPELFKGKKNLIAYSFGVGHDFSFERELVEKYGFQVYAFDPSPEVVEYMKHQVLPENLKYYPYGLSNEDEMKTFHMPSSGPDYSEYFAPWVSGKKIKMQSYRLSTLLEKYGHIHIDLLKMDIEGSEFLALPDIIESKVEFLQLCIETHARIFPDSVEKMRWIKKLMNDQGYFLVSNGREEQTYIRKDCLNV